MREVLPLLNESPQAVAIILALIAIVAPAYQAKMSHRSSMQATVETSTKNLIESLEHQGQSLQEQVNQQQGQVDVLRGEVELLRKEQNVYDSYHAYMSREFERVDAFLQEQGLAWPPPPLIPWVQWKKSHPI